jgi:hypothetical protein
MQDSDALKHLNHVLQLEMQRQQRQWDQNCDRVHKDLKWVLQERARIAAARKNTKCSCQNKMLDEREKKLDNKVRELEKNLDVIAMVLTNEMMLTGSL